MTSARVETASHDNAGDGLLGQNSACRSEPSKVMYGKIPYDAHMSTPLKDARIELRVTTAQKEAIEIAAAISGRTVTAFSADVLTERAEEVIQQDRQLRVDAEAFDAFLAVMDRPARSLEGLRDLFKRKSVFVDVG